MRSKTSPKKRADGTVELGDLVVAAFDMAAHHSADPREISRLAERTVMRVLLRVAGHQPARHGRLLA